MLPLPLTMLAAARLGIVTRPELLAAGLTSGQISGHLRRGNLEQATVGGCSLPGTYRVVGGALFPRQELMAAVARCRPEAALSGPANLGCLGVEGFEEGSDIIVRVHAERSVTNVGFLVVRDPFIRRHRAALGPLDASTVTRALVDTALLVRGKRLRVAVDSARWRGFTHPDRLRRCAEPLVPFGHGGALHLLQLIEARTFDVDSEGERVLRPILDVITPPPIWQQWVTDDIRVDAVLADAPVVVEYLGGEAHGPQHQRILDAERDRRLRALGYLPFYVVKADLAAPAVLVARILGARDAFVHRGTLRP